MIFTRSHPEMPEKKWRAELLRENSEISGQIVIGKNTKNYLYNKATAKYSNPTI